MSGLTCRFGKSAVIYLSALLRLYSSSHGHLPLYQCRKKKQNDRALELVELRVRLRRRRLLEPAHSGGHTHTIQFSQQRRMPL
ncbi:hypothetical protein VTK73DRAFT_8159 [Phialemonium thermophilum]|uniref:Secreted protein n=1 Tax=Phialemonium thermophilum TaxID=223376 RepID=A0ABR3WA66_9PEZI